MPNAILVGYATMYGSTKEVAEAIAETLREQGLEAECRPLREVRSLADYSAVVLGAPLLMYRWHKAARRFLARHRAALKERPVAIFALGPTHKPHDEEEWQDSHKQLDEALAKYPWLTPVARALFGGKFDPAVLRFPINVLAGSEPATDLRDWAAIRAWAADLKPALMA